MLYDHILREYVCTDIKQLLLLRKCFNNYRPWANIPHVCLPLAVASSIKIAINCNAAGIKGLLVDVRIRLKDNLTTFVNL